MPLNTPDPQVPLRKAHKDECFETRRGLDGGIGRWGSYVLAEIQKGKRYLLLLSHGRDTFSVTDRIVTPVTSHGSWEVTGRMRRDITDLDEAVKLFEQAREAFEQGTTAEFGPEFLFRRTRAGREYLQVRYKGSDTFRKAPIR